MGSQDGEPLNPSALLIGSSALLYFLIPSISGVPALSLGSRGRPKSRGLELGPETAAWTRDVCCHTRVHAQRNPRLA